MPPLYHQLQIHLVFAVKGQYHFIPNEHLSQLEQYLSGILQKKLNCKMLYLHCEPDHVHLFIGWNPEITLSDIVSKTKTRATSFIKQQSWGQKTFSWQKGYGAFSYSKHHQAAFIQYLRNQKTYHQQHTFREEYLHILQKFEVSYEEKYLFEFYDNLNPASTKPANFRPSTYTKIYLHYVLVVKRRDAHIPKAHKVAVQQCLTATIEKAGHRLIRINCMPDHTHILLEFRAVGHLVDLGIAMQEQSKDFIQAQSWMPYVFEWQEGFGVFSCSPSHAKIVSSYIQNQEEHHRQTTFKEEYLEMLQELGAADGFVY